MSGKTRLASEAIRAIRPWSPILIPPSARVLRDLVDEGLELDGLILWLDDLERFLKGEGSLDEAFLTYVSKHACVVATIRRTELNGLRPTSDSRPTQWDALRVFTRVLLDRKLTEKERAHAYEKIDNEDVLKAIDTYGLAEYLGGGPEALERFDDGEVSEPLGYALVRIAIDWRRTGLARAVSLATLRGALPHYLVERPDVVITDETFAAGLRWAVGRINESVALISARSREQGALPDSYYEAFDYLIDVVVDRNLYSRNAAYAIPLQLWELVYEAAQVDERSDVSEAANRYFVPRPSIMAQLAVWMTAPPGTTSPGAILSGMGGSGKSTLLLQLREFWTGLRQPIPSQGRTGQYLPMRLVEMRLAEVDFEAFSATVCDLLKITRPPPLMLEAKNQVARAFASHLLAEVSRSDVSYLVAFDDLDLSPDSAEISEFLDALRRAGNPRVRLLVASRTWRPQEGWQLIDVNSSSESELLAFLRPSLAEVDPSLREDPRRLEEVARKIINLVKGGFLSTRLAVEVYRSGGLGPLIRLEVSEEKQADHIRDLVTYSLDRLALERNSAVLLLRLLRAHDTPLTTQRIAQEAGLQDRTEYVSSLVERLSRLGLVDKARVGGPFGEQVYFVHPLVAAAL